MYLKAVSKICNFYQIPYKAVCFISNTLVMDQNKHKHQPGLKLVKKFLIKDTVRLKFQIKNSRATYIATIPDVISDYSFIASCEQTSLIEIGYFSKVEEYKRLQSLKESHQEKKSIFNSVYKWLGGINHTSENLIKPEQYHYNFIGIQSNNNSCFNVKLLITNTKHSFEVPFEDLIQDSSLLSNIYPPDLLKIGYELCSKEIIERRTPLFFL